MMQHDLIIGDAETFTTPWGEDALRVTGSCSCGWTSINERPARPGRADEMRARMKANHAAWRATPAVQEFEEAFDKLGAGTRTRIEGAMESVRPDMADFGASRRAEIETLVKAEGLPSLWAGADATRTEVEEPDPPVDMEEWVSR